MIKFTTKEKIEFQVTDKGIVERMSPKGIIIGEATIHIPSHAPNGKEIKALGNGKTKINEDNACPSYNLVVPDTVKCIRDSAFAGDYKINSISCESVEAIGAEAFRSSTLSEMKWPDACKSVEAHCFTQSSLSRFVAGANLNQVCLNAFSDCTLDELDLSGGCADLSPESLKKLCENAGISKIIPSYFMRLLTPHEEYELNGFSLDEEGNIIPKAEAASRITVKGKTFAITGTLWRGRTEIEAMIARRGGFNSPRVTRKTDYLVVGDAPGKTKVDQASKYGIPTLTEKDFEDALLSCHIV